jgi:predicted transcriptional regulator
MLSINLPAEAAEVLARMARETGRSESRIALEAIIEVLEDWEDSLIAEERMKDSGPFVSLDEVMTKLELREAEERRAKPAAE